MQTGQSKFFFVEGCKHVLSCSKVKHCKIGFFGDCLALFFGPTKLPLVNIK